MLELLGPLEHRIYDHDEMKRALDQASNRDTTQALTDLQSMGSIRPLAPVPDDFSERCSELSKQFPQFSEVIDEKIIPELAIGNYAGRGLKLPTLCIDGKPGVGKSFFAKTIADIFEIPFTRINLEGAQGGFSITGLDRAYSGHTPGQIFRFLSHQTKDKFSNGLIIFEELDKTAGDTRFNVENSLIQILEETTAKKFNDLSIPDFNLDITSLNFIFTANSLEKVSAPILSRVQAIELPDLTKSQSAQIAIAQFENLIKTLNLSKAGLFIDSKALDALSTMSPRQQKGILRSAIGKAIYEQHNKINISAKPENNHKRSPIGFL